MQLRGISEWLRHAPLPGVGGFALLTGIEAIARGILISVFPLALYQALQDAALVSKVYFVVGIVSMVIGLMVPFLTRYVPRRYMYLSGAIMYVAGSGLAVLGTPVLLVVGLLLNTMAVAVTFVCLNAYVLDYISKLELGRCESWRMVYAGLGWTVGPALGVMLYSWWSPAPFLIAGAAAVCLMAVFLYLRLGNGRLIVKARRPAPNPLAYLPRFARQPRLVAGWIFAVIRSCGWWVYVVYLPIFAIEQGLGDQLGGIALSISNGMLFLAPLMLRWIQRRSIRTAVRTGFAGAALLFVGASLAAEAPLAAVALLMGATVFLVLLDVCGGLPFLMAVKPSERTEMSAIYASYRDVSGILTPGGAWLVLLVAPVGWVFLPMGFALGLAWALAGRLHRRLGQVRDVGAEQQANRADLSEPA